MRKHHKQGLRRLPEEYYMGNAWVHWTLGIAQRRSGWLEAKFLYKFRELLTHTMFRYQLACPIFCLMPDHMHLLWTGLAPQSNQLVAMKAFRRDVNATLGRIGFELQRQPYDHVLQEDEIAHEAIESVAEYIARNPERKNLVAADSYADYPFVGCLLPGASQLTLFSDSGWDEIWRTLAFLQRTHCYRKPDPKYAVE